MILHTSRKTVEFHLSRLYQRFGLMTRVTWPSGRSRELADLKADPVRRRLRRRSRPARVAGRPLVGAALAEDGGLKAQLEQPVGVVDLEEPAARRRDHERRPAGTSRARPRIENSSGAAWSWCACSANRPSSTRSRRLAESSRNTKSPSPRCPTVTGCDLGGASPRTVARSAAPCARSSASHPRRRPRALPRRSRATRRRSLIRVARHGRILAQIAVVGIVRQMPRVRELRIALTVDDYDAAVAFYRDALGLAEVESWVRPDGRGTILDAGRATLELFDPLQAETLDRIEVGRRLSGPSASRSMWTTRRPPPRSSSPPVRIARASRSRPRGVTGTCASGHPTACS